MVEVQPQHQVGDSVRQLYTVRGTIGLLNDSCTLVFNFELIVTQALRLR